MSSNDASKIRLINCGVKAFTRQANEGGKLLKAASAGDPSELVPEESNGKKDEPSDEKGMEKDKDKEMVFRFVYEGVQAVIPFIDSSYILHAGLRELKRMLETYYPSLVDFEGSEFGSQVHKSGELPFP